MRYVMWLSGLALLFIAADAAAVEPLTINGIDYVLFAKTAISLESGPLILFGDLAVNDAGGLLRIGGGNVVIGTAVADRLSLVAGAQVFVCEFNSSAGADPAGVCEFHDPVVVPITATWPPVPVPATDPCVSDGARDLTVRAGEMLELPADGCFGAVDVKDGAVLVLSPGATYNFGSLRLQHGSLLVGGDAVLNVKGQVVTEPSATIDDVTINTLGSRGAVIAIGNGSALGNVRLAAPNGTVQLNRDTLILANVGILADRIVVAPVKSAIP